MIKTKLAIVAVGVAVLGAAGAGGCAVTAGVGVLG
jgi:hypothetical protein